MSAQVGLLIKIMRLRKFIIILPFLWWAFDVRAQVSGQMPVPEQWQSTLDVIKSKVQTMVIENNRLQVEYRKLMERAQKLQQSIDAQQYKNEQMSRFLKERHGRTDQQVRIEELTRIIKIKNQEARAFDKQLGNLKRKQSNLDRKVNPHVDEQLTQLRKQLEDESMQEVLLENERGALKTGDKTQKMSN
jgi:regulator of replication initiation timing